MALSPWLKTMGAGLSYVLHNLFWFWFFTQASGIWAKSPIRSDADLVAHCVIYFLVYCVACFFGGFLLAINLDLNGFRKVRS